MTLILLFVALYTIRGGLGATLLTGEKRVALGLKSN